jgi:High potential iron-sulfur protein
MSLKKSHGSSRRVFMLQAVAASGAALAGAAHAQAPAKVDEKEPLAVSLGYVADAAKADKKKYPGHTKDQKCGNCVLYTGKAGDASGPCSLFAGKLVAANGWCGSWVKKPA